MFHTQGAPSCFALFHVPKLCLRIWLVRACHIFIAFHAATLLLTLLQRVLARLLITITNVLSIRQCAYPVACRIAVMLVIIVEAVELSLANGIAERVTGTLILASRILRWAHINWNRYTPVCKSCQLADVPTLGIADFLLLLHCQRLANKAIPVDYTVRAAVQLTRQLCPVSACHRFAVWRPHPACPMMQVFVHRSCQ